MRRNSSCSIVLQHPVCRAGKCSRTTPLSISDFQDLEVVAFFSQLLYLSTFPRPLRLSMYAPPPPLPLACPGMHLAFLFLAPPSSCCLVFPRFRREGDAGDAGGERSKRGSVVGAPPPPDRVANVRPLRRLFAPVSEHTHYFTCASRYETAYAAATAATAAGLVSVGLHGAEAYGL